MAADQGCESAESLPDIEGEGSCYTVFWPHWLVRNLRVLRLIGSSRAPSDCNLFSSAMQVTSRNSKGMHACSRLSDRFMESHLSP